MLIRNRYAGIGIGASAVSPTSSIAPPPSGSNLGLFYLLPSYKENPAPDLNYASGLGLNNQYMQGFLIREYHKLIQPTSDPLSRDWAWLEGAVSECETRGKLAGMQNLSGSTVPDWVWDEAGAIKLDYGGGHEDLPFTTVCWDPIWQGIWQSLNIEMAAHFDGRLAYIVVSGVGSGSESFLIQNPDPQFMQNAEDAAVAAGYPDAVTAWQAGTKWIIDMMAEVWPNTKMVLTTGNPFPPGTTTPDSIVALHNMYVYGNETYPERFGCRPNNLTHGSPKSWEPSVTNLKLTSPSCIATGFQFGNNQNGVDPNPPAFLGTALQKGIDYGAHFMELFSDDADDPVSVPVLIDAMTLMQVT